MKIGVNKNKRRLLMLASAVLLSSIIHILPAEAAASEEDVSGRTSMSMESFWHGELNEKAASGTVTFDLSSPEVIEETGFYQSPEIKDISVNHVDVVLNRQLLANAMCIEMLGLGNAQTEAFLSQARKITFDERSTEEIYALKQLLPSGGFSERQIIDTAEAESSAAVVGDGTGGTKEVTYDDHAVAEIFLYLNVLDFAAYADAFQGAKIIYAGDDGIYDIDEDVKAGTVLTLDTSFLEDENCLILRIDKNEDRFAQIGSGSCNVLLMAAGYQDCSASVTLEFPETEDPGGADSSGEEEASDD